MLEEVLVVQGNDMCTIEVVDEKELALFVNLLDNDSVTESYVYEQLPDPNTFLFKAKAFSFED